ncbi:MAG: nucleotidyltransferase domain-containing protein [Chloroflexota bacterium]|nr:nucleotidyltransferase domain-containing protein [Chloroflexota bacterium]
MDEAALREICQKHDLKLVILFGSRAKGCARQDSDYDVGVLRRQGIIPPEQFLELAYRLSRALDMGNVDLVDLRRASPLLKYEAARSARVLYEAEAGFFDCFHVYAWKLYQDARYDFYRFYPIYIERSLERLLS